MNKVRENVRDYPRPPRVEASTRHIQVIAGGEVIADTKRAKRVLETTHPPVFYIPPDDVRREYLRPSSRHTLCEWKGEACYYTLKIGDRVIDNAAWYYPNPTAPFASLRNFLAFYPDKMDVCLVDGEVARPQAGTFYGGWITDEIVGM